MFVQNKAQHLSYTTRVVEDINGKSYIKYIDIVQLNKQSYIV